MRYALTGLIFLLGVSLVRRLERVVLVARYQSVFLHNWLCTGCARKPLDRVARLPRFERVVNIRDDLNQHHLLEIYTTIYQKNKMPHAESPNPPSSPPVDDTVMEEAVSGALDEQAESQIETTQSSPAPTANEVEKASLEDMFDDDDMNDDDEFSSSAQTKTQASSQPAP